MDSETKNEIYNALSYMRDMAVEKAGADGVFVDVRLDSKNKIRWGISGYSNNYSIYAEGSDPIQAVERFIKQSKERTKKT